MLILLTLSYFHDLLGKKCIYVYRKEKKTPPMASRRIRIFTSFDVREYTVLYTNRQSEKSIMLTECAYCTMHSAFFSSVHMYIIRLKHASSLPRHINAYILPLSQDIAN